MYVGVCVRVWRCGWEVRVLFRDNIIQKITSNHDKDKKINVFKYF